MRDKVLMVGFVLLAASCVPEKVESPSTEESAGPTTWNVSGPGGGSEVIHLQDAMGDLAKATAAGDWRFVGVMGVGLIVAGIAVEKGHAMADKYGVKVRHQGSRSAMRMCASGLAMGEIIVVVEA